MSSWSPWTLNESRGNQDLQEWHLYRARLFNGEYIYYEHRYSKLVLPVYVVSNSLGISLKMFTLLIVSVLNS